MSRIVTHADVFSVPDGSVLTIEHDARLTPLAEERLRARGVTVARSSQSGQADQVADLVATVTQQVLGRLGHADPALIEQVVSEALTTVSDGTSQGLPPGGAQAAAEYCVAFLEQERSRKRRRAILTTTGRNQKGIVARLTAVIADLGGDILDLSQTLVSDYFSMIVVVDVATLSVSFQEFKAAIEAVGQEIGFQCMVMHEDLVTSLGRV